MRILIEVGGAVAGATGGGAVCTLIFVWSVVDFTVEEPGVTRVVAPHPTSAAAMHMSTAPITSP